MPYSDSKEIKQLTEKHLNNLKEKIQRRLSSKGIDNTGQASASLEVKDNALLGIDYIYYLDKGRRPGRFPPVDAMRKWVQTKLRVPTSEQNSIAFLVGRKIAQEGTEIYLNPSKGLELEGLIDETLKELTKELPGVMVAVASKQIDNLYK